MIVHINDLPYDLLKYILNFLFDKQLMVEWRKLYVQNGKNALRNCWLKRKLHFLGYY